MQKTTKKEGKIYYFGTEEKEEKKKIRQKSTLVKGGKAMCKESSTATTINTNMQDDDDDYYYYKDEKNFPILGKVWLRVYRSIVHVIPPMMNLDFSFAIAAAIFLIAVRVVVTYMLQAYAGFPMNDPASFEVSGNAAAAAHSMLLVPALIVGFMTHKYSPSEHLSLAPSHWQEFVDALLQFCTGYMIYDAIFTVILRWDPALSWIPAFQFDDYLFLIHHLMTSSYMTMARYYKAGHMSAMMCMLLGEASNPFSNAHFAIQRTMALGDCCNGPVLQSAKVYVEFAFALVYASLRTTIGPIIFAPMSWNLLFSKEAKQNLPLAVRSLWVFMIVAVVLGSYFWVKFTVGVLQRHVLVLLGQEL